MAKTNAERQRAYRERHQLDGTLKKQDPERVAKRRALTKENVLTHYGNRKCACVVCGEDRMNCLSLDHKDGNGSQHRKSINRNGYHMYGYLIRENYPEGFQTLCMNCQWIKRYERKEYNHISRTGQKEEKVTSLS